MGRELALQGLVLDRPTRTCTRIPGSAFLLNPEFAAEAKELTLSDSRLIPALEVIATRVLSNLPADELLPAVASVAEAVMDMQSKSGAYSRATAWASTTVKSAPHEWHGAWSTGHIRRVGMVSKAHGRGGAGADKWDYAGTAALAMHATGRQFYNFIEEAHENVISNQKVEHGATLVAKYKGIRIFDEDIGEGTYYRIRADRFSWVGKRAGGWLATCDEMPSDDPSEGPSDDKERTDE